jgi:hypothetical protein
MPVKSKNKISSKSKSKSKGKEKKTIKDNFEDKGNSFTDVIDMLSMSPSAENPKAVTFQEQLSDFGILFMKNGFLVSILTLNFLGLSVSLNCNADQELTQRIFAAIFAFFFGFVYLIVNYYTYRVIGQGKICKMNPDKLFPFKV